MDHSITPAERLVQIAAQLKGKKTPQTVTTREFLAWFHAQRRGSWVVWRIRSALNDAGLRTVPDFEGAYIDSYIEFELLSSPKGGKGKETERVSEVGELAVSDAVAAPSIRQDPTYRVSKLAAANQPVISVNPDSSIEHVVTKLMEHDISQVPVMTSPREVKGVVTWGSIGSRMALSQHGSFARDYMEGHYEVKSSDSMFEVIQTIIEKDYVLVRAEDNSVSGIITASDLSIQFRSLSEPFLLLSEIENLIRILIDGRFEVEELRQCVLEGDTTRVVDGVADLNFGEYIRLLENNDRWKKFGVGVDRATFCSGLDKVRRIRNDVMHFDPDGVEPEDLEKLRDYTKFIKKLYILVGSGRSGSAQPA
jgi:hypothetical protein